MRNLLLLSKIQKLTKDLENLTMNQIFDDPYSKLTNIVNIFLIKKRNYLTPKLFGKFLDLFQKKFQPKFNAIKKSKNVDKFNLNRLVAIYKLRKQIIIKKKQFKSVD